jgi:hypothetical protein
VRNINHAAQFRNCGHRPRAAAWRQLVEPGLALPHGLHCSN